MCHAPSNGTPDSPAKALAIKVFPVPGPVFKLTVDTCDPETFISLIYPQ